MQIQFKRFSSFDWFVKSFYPFMSKDGGISNSPIANDAVRFAELDSSFHLMNSGYFLKL